MRRLIEDNNRLTQKEKSLVLRLYDNSDDHPEMFHSTIKTRDRWMLQRLDVNISETVREVDNQLEFQVNENWVSDSENNVYFKGDLENLSFAICALLMKFRTQREIMEKIVVRTVSVDSKDLKNATAHKRFLANFRGVADSLGLRSSPEDDL